MENSTWGPAPLRDNTEDLTWWFSIFQDSTNLHDCREVPVNDSDHWWLSLNGHDQEALTKGDATAGVSETHTDERRPNEHSAHPSRTEGHGSAQASLSSHSHLDILQFKAVSKHLPRNNHTRDKDIAKTKRRIQIPHTCHNA